MRYEQIVYEVNDGVALVTLHRPEKLNAMTALMGAELEDAMAEADADDAVRAVVVTGAGRAFCAGPIEVARRANEAIGRSPEWASRHGEGLLLSAADSESGGLDLIPRSVPRRARASRRAGWQRRPLDRAGGTGCGPRSPIPRSLR